MKCPCLDKKRFKSIFQKNIRSKEIILFGTMFYWKTSFYLEQKTIFKLTYNLKQYQIDRMASYLKQYQIDRISSTFHYPIDRSAQKMK